MTPYTYKRYGRDYLPSVTISGTIGALLILGGIGLYTDTKTDFFREAWQKVTGQPSISIPIFHRLYSNVNQLIEGTAIEQGLTDINLTYIKEQIPQFISALKP